MLRNICIDACAAIIALSLASCGRGLSSNSSTAGNTPSPSSSQPGGSGNSGGSSGSGSGSAGSGGSGGSSGGGSSSETVQYVYVANQETFNVSGYKINADGTLTPVPGSPYPVPGSPPHIFDPTYLARVGNFLYASGSDPNSSNGITGFKINSADGSLTKFNPSQGDAGSYFFLSADTQRGVIYASGTGPAGKGSTSVNSGISAFKVNSDGTLTLIGGQVQQVTSTPPGTTPVDGALAVDAQGRFLFDFFFNKIHVFPRNPDGSLGAEVSGSPFAAGTPYTFSSPDDPNACFLDDQDPVIVADTAGRFVYSSCDANAEVNVFSVSNSGRLTLVGSVPNSGPQSELSSLALSHDGSVLFGTQEERNQVLSFTIDRSSGMPTLASTTPAGTRPNSAAVDVSNRFVYVTNGSSNISKNNDHEGSANLSEYTVTPAGIMTQLPGSPIATGAAPKAVVVASF